MRTRAYASLVVMSVLASCKPADSPEKYGTSHVELTFKEMDARTSKGPVKRTVDGIAFARHRKDTGDLEIRVYRDPDPPVDCDTLDAWVVDPKKGALAMVTSSRFDGKPGKLSIENFSFGTGNAATGDAEMQSDSDAGRATTLTLTAYGPTGFAGTFSNAGGADYTPQAKGTLRGKVCPATTSAEIMKKNRLR